MIKNILVPLDGSEHSKAAFDYALWMTQKFDGTLFGQHVIDTISIEGTFFHDISGSWGSSHIWISPRKMREVLEERGKMILEEFAERCRKSGIKHQTFLDMGLIANEICERSKIADLVVIGHRGDQRGILPPGFSARPPKPSRANARVRCLFRQKNSSRRKPAAGL